MDTSIVAAAAGAALPDWSLWVAVGLVLAGLLGAGTLLFATGRKEADLSVEERVALYASGAGVAAPGPGGHRATPASEYPFETTKAAAEALLKRNKSLEEKLALQLEAAGSGFKASEWLLLRLGVIVVAGFLGLLIGGGNVILGLLFLALGFAGPSFFLKFKRAKRVKSFNSQLPDTLQLMSGSLSAGLSLAQSVDTIVNEGTEPMASEFRKVLVETRLGVELEDALEGIVERFDSKDFGWVVMAIRIQRQVGGNLGELLDTVAGTIRERDYMRRQVDALASEGKISAMVIGGLPPVFTLYLLLVQRDYVMPMFTEPLGLLMLGAACAMLGVGIFWTTRLIKMEV
ncbi:type II secretion system F family protein [Nocardioides yefusunii]|uniref:Type II secretion system F family protein n=1 Tax=Nocardioides yefusunii TaxID=2500546 RepID=A0ABW1QXJ4_9ACTN|nr:type II secretion system F family protein [Nocardioides yefusunii]